MSIQMHEAAEVPVLIGSEEVTFHDDLGEQTHDGRTIQG